MKYYVQKPTVVKAMRYTGDNATDIIKFIPKAYIARAGDITLIPGMWYGLTDHSIFILSDDEFRERYYSIYELGQWADGAYNSVNKYPFEGMTPAGQDGYIACQPDLPRNMGLQAQQTNEKNPFPVGTKHHNDWLDGRYG